MGKFVPLKLKYIDKSKLIEKDTFFFTVSSTLISNERKPKTYLTTWMKREVVIQCKGSCLCTRKWYYWCTKIVHAGVVVVVVLRQVLGTFAAIHHDFFQQEESMTGKSKDCFKTSLTEPWYYLLYCSII